MCPHPAIHSPPPAATDTATAAGPVSSHPPSHIPLPTSDLLLAVAACDATAPEIAARFDLTLEDYLDWLSTPDTARRLSALIAQAEALRLKRLEARHDSALETLHTLHQKAEENADPIERRRAATAVARFSVFSRAQSSNISRLFRGLSITPAAPANADVPGPDGEPAAHAAPPIRHPASNRTIRPAFILPTALPITPPRPDPALAPAQSTMRLLQLLQTCDEPRRGHGLRALFNHFTPVWQGRIEARSADEFARAPIDAYRTLINHRSAVLHATRFEEPPPWVRDGPIHAHQSFDFVDIDNRRWSATFEFSRQASRPGMPWLIDAVHLAPASAAAFPTSPTPSSPLPSTSDIAAASRKGEVPLKAGEGAPAFPSASSTTPLSSTSDIPLPTSHIPKREAPLSPDDLAADAARLADLDRPRQRPPPAPIPESHPAEIIDPEPAADPAMRAARSSARLMRY